MAYFDITVYGTNKLYNQVGYEAVRRARQYLDKAFNYSPHDANVDAPAPSIPAPTEAVFADFSADYPCDRSFQIDYNNLGEWWDDYSRCGGLNNVGSDCTLLLTARGALNGGITVRNKYSVAATGLDISNLPSDHQLYGGGNAAEAMETAFHETVHALLKGGQGGFNEHKLGRIYSHSNTGRRAKTPMTHELSNETNECGTYVGTTSDFENRYSNCCESKMRHT